jgi:hypothetical protein
MSDRNKERDKKIDKEAHRETRIVRRRKKGKVVPVLN